MKTKLDIQKLMALEEQKKYEDIQKFRQTPFGKLCAVGRKTHTHIIVNIPNRTTIK